MEINTQLSNHQTKLPFKPIVEYNQPIFEISGIGWFR
jgi:hypothetical protein